MAPLESIYLTSAALALIALAAGCAVIVLRLVRTRALAREAGLRAKVLPGVLAAAETGLSHGELIAALEKHPGLFRDIVAELAEILRGQSRDNLVRLARDCGLDVWLRTQLRSHRTEDCRLAGECLRLFDDRDSVNALKRALDDPRPDIRLIAALALAELERTPPLIVLLPKLAAGTEERSMLLRRLFEQIARRDAGELIRVAAGRIGDAALRPVAIAALGATGRGDLGNELKAMAFDRDPAVRAAIHAALADLGSMSAKDLIGAGLNDDAWEVRVAAVEAARRMSLSEFVPELSRRLDDEIWWVRFRAGEALVALGEAGINSLRRLAQSEHDRSRRMASLVMAERGVA